MFSCSRSHPCHSKSHFSGNSHNLLLRVNATASECVCVCGNLLNWVGMWYFMKGKWDLSVFEEYFADKLRQSVELVKIDSHENDQP
jgi:hypothetical protein